MHLSSSAPVVVGFLLGLLAAVPSVWAAPGSTSSDSPEEQFPFLLLSVGNEIWELGAKINWDDLARMLAPITNGSFFVTDEKREKHLDGIRRLIDSSRSPESKTTAILLLTAADGGDNGTLAQQLLSLGIDPDIPDLRPFRASHVTGMFSRKAIAEALMVCRVNLTALDANENTPLDAASEGYRVTIPGYDETELRQTRPLVRKIWLKAETYGFPSLAELASQQKWWAVQHLCRRGVVEAEEFEERYSERTAEQWAAYYGEYGVAVEVRYYALKHKTNKERCQAENEELVTDVKKLVEAMQHLLPLSHDSDATNRSLATLMLEP